MCERIENRTNQLKALIITYTNECEGDYLRVNRYDSCLLVSSFRGWLALRAVSTQWADHKVYRLIAERLEYLFDLKADYEIVKRKLGINDVQVARLFGYQTQSTYNTAVRKNAHITHFLNMARLFCK